MRFFKPYKYYLRQFIILVVAYSLLKISLFALLQKQVNIEIILKDAAIFSFITTWLFISYFLEKINNIKFKQVKNDKRRSKAYITLNASCIKEAKHQINMYVDLKNAEIEFENSKMKILRNAPWIKKSDEFEMIKDKNSDTIEINMDLSKYGEKKDLRKLKDLSLIHFQTLHRRHA